MIVTLVTYEQKDVSSMLDKIDWMILVVFFGKTLDGSF